MYKRLLLSSSILITASFSMFAAHAAVTWDKASALNNHDFTTQGLTNKTTNVVFIRPTSSHADANDSINIAINDRFLTSLQAGHYSSSVVCTTGTKISAYPTAAKSNDLLANAQSANLIPNQVQFYQVESQTGYAPTLKAVDAKTAERLLQGTYRQAHQISRVDTANCQLPAPTATKVAPAVLPVVATPVAARPAQTQTPSLQLNVLFDTNKSVVKPAYQSEIDRAAAFLANYPNMHAIIEGHTDSQGDARYNQRLSQQRAEAVRQALITHHGIDTTRLSAVGYGEDKPVATNTTSEGRSQNRRVVVTIPNQ